MPAPKSAVKKATFKEIGDFIERLGKLKVGAFAYGDEWQVQFAGMPDGEDDDMSQDPHIGFDGDRSCCDDDEDCE